MPLADCPREILAAVEGVLTDIDETVSTHSRLTGEAYGALEALKKECGRDLFAEGFKTNKSFAMFDKVNGTDATRTAFEAGTSASAIVASWKTSENAFRELRKKYLLY